MKQQDLLRSAALGRTKRLTAKALFLCPPGGGQHLPFATPDLAVIREVESLSPFLDRVRAA
jgi:hypothetical protein